MNFEVYKDIVKTFKLKKRTKRFFLDQIELFETHNNNQKECYDIGDEIILKKECSLIHGTKASIDDLKKISDYGLISSEFYSDLNIYKKKPYVVELWNIKETIKLSDWLKKYTGVTINFKNNDGVIYKSEICSIDDVKGIIKKEQGFRDYIIYQNQEQRFLPNDICNNSSTVAFIVEYDINDQLIKNDILSKSFDDKISKDLLPKWFYQKYLKQRTFDNYETDREKAIIFGIPKDMIKGIIVSRDIEKNLKQVSEIKQLFSNCYICNLDGKVIIK